jgi:diadenosine tetraphosphate (Ap4A) HIT family hydrolase
MTVALDPRLAADTVPLGRFALCRVLLMNDARYPWLVLVPERPGLRELFDLDDAGQGVLMREMSAAARALAEAYQPDKINVGALGNIVAQLHVHVVARRVGDPAWPGPVWGHGTAAPYAAPALAAVRERIVPRLGAGFAAAPND